MCHRRELVTTIWVGDIGDRHLYKYLFCLGVAELRGCRAARNSPQTVMAFFCNGDS